MIVFLSGLFVGLVFGAIIGAVAGIEFVLRAAAGGKQE